MTIKERLQLTFNKLKMFEYNNCYLPAAWQFGEEPPSTFFIEQARKKYEKILFGARLGVKSVMRNEI